MQELSHKPFKGMSETAVRLMLRAQYFMPLYYGMTIYEDDSIPTLCTNGASLWVNPAFWSQLNRDQRLTAAAHEIGHKMLLHTTRRGERNPFIWNCAGDYVINLMLAESGFVPLSGFTINGKPFTWLYDEKYAGMTTEAVYDAIIKEAEERYGQTGKAPPQNGSKGKSQGQGNGTPAPGSAGVGDTGRTEEDQEQADGQHGGNGRERAIRDAEKRLGGFRDLVDFGDDPQGNKTEDGVAGDFEQKVRKELKEAEMTAKMAGNAPGWLERVVGNAFHSKVNWFEVLEQWIRGLSQADYSWSRFSRREFVKSGALSPDVYQPALGGIVVFADTSGSISGHELAIYGKHLIDIFEQVKPKWVEIVWFDTRVHGVQRFERGEYEDFQPTPVGGGGTDFSWFARYIEEDVEERPDVVMCLTDMYGPFGPEVELPFIWLSTSNIDEAPYGQVIQVQ